MARSRFHSFASFKCTPILCSLPTAFCLRDTSPVPASFLGRITVMPLNKLFFLSRERSGSPTWTSVGFGEWLSEILSFCFQVGPFVLSRQSELKDRIFGKLGSRIQSSRCPGQRQRLTQRGLCSGGLLAFPGLGPLSVERMWRTLSDRTSETEKDLILVFYFIR